MYIALGQDVACISENSGLNTLEVRAASSDEVKQSLQAVQGVSKGEAVSYDQLGHFLHTCTSN